MSPPESYKSKARDVRHAAQARLRQIRAERAARRQSALETPSGAVRHDRAAGAGADAAMPMPVPETEATPSRGPDMALSRDALDLMEDVDVPRTSGGAVPPDAAGTPPAGPETLSGAPAPGGTPAPPMADPVPDPGPDTGHDIQTDTEQAPDNETAGPRAAEVPPSEHHIVAGSAPADAAPRSEEPGGSTDLRDLPGAGEGLVWLLQQQGIRSLDDLSRADAAELAERLDLVGRLINLDSWIAFARDRRAADAG